MVCLDCGNRDIRYDEKEKSYHCNNCGSRNLGARKDTCKYMKDGKEIVYKVNAGQMYKDGYKFFLSVNNVWLTKEVPVKYLNR